MCRRRRTCTTSESRRARRVLGSPVLVGE
jgi:hypothetical protein